jgi:hypothetical protein
VRGKGTEPFPTVRLSQDRMAVEPFSIFDEWCRYKRPIYRMTFYVGDYFKYDRFNEKNL